MDKSELTEFAVRGTRGLVYSVCILHAGAIIEEE